MRKRLRQKRISLFFICTFVVCSIFTVFSLSVPSELYLLSGKNNVINYDLPINVKITSENNQILKVNGNIASDYEINLKEPLTVESEQPGIVDLQLKVFGIIPANVKVKVIPDIKLYPSGQLIGVKLETRGVIVVGLEELDGKDGNTYNPGKDSQLMLGDIIYKIDGIEVNTAEEVSQMINNLNGEKIKLYVHRNGKKLKLVITPVLCEDDKYRIGLWVRDNTAGIGTMTFYEEESGTFGALGHPITDITTNITVPVKGGEIVSSKVLSILPGKSGTPGEIRGVFYNEDETLGSLSKNTDFGVYGRVASDKISTIYDKPLDIGLQNDIKIGKAQILTTLEDKKIESFEVYIEEVNKQNKKSGKGIVLRVTDEKLLEETGGIIQGMSGSPIIQDGKIIGAVTHVFVNDPTKGYGIFVEWMLEEAGLVE